MDNVLLMIALALFISATFIIKNARKRLMESKSLLDQTLKYYVQVLTLYRDLLLVSKHEDLHKLMGSRISKEWIYK